MIPEIESVSEMDTFVSVGSVVGCKGGEDPQLNARGIAILLHRADDFDGDFGLSFPVPGLDDFAKGSLAEKAVDGVCGLDKQQGLRRCEVAYIFR